MPVSIPVGLSGEISTLLSPAKLCQPGFFRNVLVVTFGTGFAQLLSVCLSPILSRLYGPADFGLFGSFISISSVLSAGVTLQYAEALMLPEKDEQAAGLFAAACWSALVITVVLTGMALAFPSWCAGVLRAPELKSWFWLIPLAAFVTGLNQTLTAWCARRKEFKRSAATQIVRSVAANGSQAMAGMASWGSGGLIGGVVLGDIIANVVLFLRVARADGRLLLEGARRSAIWAAAKEHREFAFYSTPQNVLNAVSQGAPVILLIHYYGAVVGGFYAFSIRVMQAPMSLILISLRQVLFQRLTEVHNRRGNLRGMFFKSTGMLFAISVIPATLGFILAPRCFAFVFGKDWLVAGEYARWLILWLVPGFCNLPAALVARILRQQRNLLLFDVGLLASRIAVLILGGVNLTAMHTVVAFSVVGAVFNILLILGVWRLIAFEYDTEEGNSPSPRTAF